MRKGMMKKCKEIGLGGDEVIREVSEGYGNYLESESKHGNCWESGWRIWEWVKK